MCRVGTTITQSHYVLYVCLCKLHERVSVCWSEAAEWRCTEEKDVVCPPVAEKDSFYHVVFPQRLFTLRQTRFWPDEVTAAAACVRAFT